ncbi:MAG: DNRLRE domain-containing protein [Candidatus Electrothrix sp. ATG1]|nr:DNRLRE domain-containing protein [Candidatus Electrothrix sp. ATG1]
MGQADIGPAVVMNSVDTSVGYKDWDVTGLVTDWLADPDLNYGLLVNSDAVASSDSHRFFASSEAGDASQRPKLVVKYTIADMSAPRIINMFLNN